MPEKRVRTTEGSCWPCKQKRVKCDLQKPNCRKCVGSGAKCNYNKVLIKWNTRPSKTTPTTVQPTLDRSPFASIDCSLATNEKRAIEYFQARVWPLLSTSKRPCPPPLNFALQEKSVLLATCVLADSHRVLHDGRNSRENVQNKRMHCLATLRRQLAEASNGDMPLSTILVAVLLLYFSDGYIDCTQGSSSTATHHAGVRAIIESLGGLSSTWEGGERSVKMLLSEFATTDLTDVVLHGGSPCFLSTVWDLMDCDAVWWDRPILNTESLASVLKKLSELAFYKESIESGNQELSINVVREFEESLRPTYAAITDVSLGSNEAYSQPPDENESVASQSLCMAFQHSAYLYLYRGICDLPGHHPLVQQHVNACMNSILGLRQNSKALNCAIFPLYIAAAHTFIPDHRRLILAKFDQIYDNIKFDAVNSIRSALGVLWDSPQQHGSWYDMFSTLDKQTLVL